MYEKANGQSNNGITADDIAESEAQVRSAVVTIARLLGRQIAREHFGRLEAVSDDAPAGEAGDGEEQRSASRCALRPLLLGSATGDLH